MASELAGGSKLTQFVANHILSNVYGHMLAVWPTNSGKMVEERLQVLTTLFLPASFIASTFFIRESAT